MSRRSGIRSATRTWPTPESTARRRCSSRAPTGGKAWAIRPPRRRSGFKSRWTEVPAPANYGSLCFQICDISWLARVASEISISSIPEPSHNVRIPKAPDGPFAVAKGRNSGLASASPSPRSARWSIALNLKLPLWAVLTSIHRDANERRQVAEGDARLSGGDGGPARSAAAPVAGVVPALRRGRAACGAGAGGGAAGVIARHPIPAMNGRGPSPPSSCSWFPP